MIVEILQATLGCGRICALESGSGVVVDVSARVQPEAAEQTLLLGGQVTVREVEGGGN